jgi:hypothetical protein
MGHAFSIQSFSLGIIFGVVLTGAWFLGNGKPAESTSADIPLALATTSASTAATPAANTPDASGAVSVSDQKAGMTVLVESVTVPPPGVWVAVREVTASGLGNILGAALAKGPRSSFPVPLLRATEPGNAYAVELYRDDGDGLFDPNSDSAYVDFATSDPVIAQFTTTE